MMVLLVSNTLVLLLLKEASAPEASRVRRAVPGSGYLCMLSRNRIQRHAHLVNLDDHVSLVGSNSRLHVIPWGPCRRVPRAVAMSDDDYDYT